MSKHKIMEKQTSVFKQYLGETVFGIPRPTKRGDIAKLKVLMMNEIEHFLVESAKKRWKEYVQTLP